MSRITTLLKFIVFIAASLFIIGALMVNGNNQPKPQPTPLNQLPQAELASVPPATPTVPVEAAPAAALPAPDDGCVECHTNQETLIETAADETEDAESLSEGEG